MLKKITFTVLYHFRASYKVVFGHLYSVILIFLIRPSILLIMSPNYGLNRRALTLWGAFEMAMLVSQNWVKFLSDHFRKSHSMLLEDNIVPERHVGQRETGFDFGATDFAIYDQRCWILRQVTHGLHDSCRGLPQGETSCWKSRWQRCCPAPREPWSVSCWKIRVQRPRKYKFQNALPVTTIEMTSSNQGKLFKTSVNYQDKYFGINFGQKFGFDKIENIYFGEYLIGIKSSISRWAAFW